MEKNIKLIPKQEIIENKSIIEETHNINPSPNPNPIPTIDLSSSSDSDSDDGVADGRKKRRIDEASGLILPLGFLDPLPTKELTPLALPSTSLLPVPASDGTCVLQSNCKQFWKAGDYEVAPTSRHWDSSSGGMDHVRVHPKFLHSNATSHKWVLGAFAELLDNSLDEVCNGATYVNIDMILNKKDGSRMLLIDDDGGGMNPDKMRQCMSLGYSAKSKMADTIGQYGNGFKTSTMRLGADVIVFSRCHGSDGNGPTESIGLLSYTFLMSTGKEDIVVPMLDYEKRGQEWSKIVRSSVSDWNKNVETIVQWSPFASEADLLRQFNQMKNHGTRIIIYNLWEDDERLLELDFDADPHDIQIRGVNRDEKNIQMAKLYPNSRHFLTYRHSLRSYASILYLRIPPGFRMILRGKDVEHHNIVNDMMMTQEVTYRPQPGADGVQKDANMVAIVTIGFVKDAKAHIDVQGFNVYHKNRLIKPFWRLWHPPGSDGRGVIGVLEANFVEPAHDKQGFERTTVLSRLEARLVQMQKTYWTTNCHKIGYAPRGNKKANLDRESSPECTPNAFESKRKNSALNGKSSVSSQKQGARVDKYANPLDKSNGNNGHLYNKADGRNKTSRQRGSSSDLSSPSEEYLSDADVQSTIAKNQTSGYSQKSSSSNSKKSFVKDGTQTMHTPPGFKRTEAEQKFSSDRRSLRSTTLKSKGDNVSEPSPSNSDSQALHQLREENRELRERVKRKEQEMLGDLLRDLQQEKERCKSLESQLEEATHKIEAMNKEQENLIDIFAEERQRRDLEEENLRKKLKEASHTIQELLNKVKVLENKTPGGESDRQWKR